MPKIIVGDVSKKEPIITIKFDSVAECKRFYAGLDEVCGHGVLPIGGTNSCFFEVPHQSSIIKEVGAYVDFTIDRPVIKFDCKRVQMRFEELLGIPEVKRSILSRSPVESDHCMVYFYKEEEKNNHVAPPLTAIPYGTVAHILPPMVVQYVSPLTRERDPVTGGWEQASRLCVPTKPSPVVAGVGLGASGGGTTSCYL